MLLAHEREIAVVAALVHDVGKLYTLAGTPEADIRKRLVEHDGLTLELLAPALADLDAEWADAGLALRHILTAKSPGARYGIPERSAMAIAVRCADRMSQELNLQRKRLGAAPGLAKLSRYRWTWVPAETPNLA